MLLERIYLIGYMGSGKTTVGKKLSRRLGFRFLDLDEYIEKNTIPLCLYFFQNMMKKHSEK